MLNPTKVSQIYSLAQLVFYELEDEVLPSAVRSARYDFKEGIVYYTIVTSKDKVIEVPSNALHKISRYMKKGQSVVFYPELFHDSPVYTGVFDSYNQFTDEVAIYVGEELSHTGYYYVPFRRIISAGGKCFISQE